VTWIFYFLDDIPRRIVIDGLKIDGDERRGKGICPNQLMRADEVLGNVCLTDPIGASASFFDTKVKLEKV
jgi:hypothetical protein